MRTAYFENVLRMQDDRATQQKGGHMAAKQTYSIRLDADQRLQLDARAESMDLPVGCLIRLAIDAYLKQQEEKDYLSEVEKRIAVTIDRLARQVAKDRAEQQMVVGMLDYFRERLPLQFTNTSKAKVTTFLEEKTQAALPCPACGTGSLFPKEGKKGLYWYCSNLKASPKCEATFPDADGRPLFPSAETTGQY